MNDERFIVVPEWMIDQGLTGNRVLVFAVIYGYSKDGGWFQGSISYLCKRTGMSRSSAVRALQSLCEDGFLRKRDRPHKGMKYVDYQAVPSTKMKPVSKRHGGSVKMTQDPVSKRHTKVNKKIKTKEITRARGKFNDYPQRTYDYDALERKLLSLRNRPDDIETH